jgi:membrane-associated phospholipid phosphatase
MLVFTSVARAPDGGPSAATVSADGGDIPIIAAGASPGVASVLAPELVSDGGVLPDGGLSPIVAPESLSVYAVNFPVEVAVTAGFFGVYVMVDLLIKPTLGGFSPCVNGTLTGQCNPADLSGFDRYAVGKSSTGWSALSDVSLAVSLIFPAVYLAFESLTLPTRTPVGDYVNDMVVIAESLAATATLQTVLKFAFRRPRPNDYLPGGGTATNIDAQLSLPSGHTSLVAAATAALTTTVFLRHPDSRVRYVFLGAGIALSLLTGLARVEAGLHFPTDAITGLLLGTSLGFAVPMLHRAQDRLRPSVAFNPATGTMMFGLAGAL